MGNIAYITTRKQIKSYDMMSLLDKINKKRFNGKITITPAHDGWEISYGKDGTYGWGFWIHPDSPRKLACKHPIGSWMGYVFVVFQEELAKLTNGILSDEGVSDRWKPKPHKYPSYQSWIEILYSGAKEIYPDRFQEILEFELKFAPEDMRKY